MHRRGDRRRILIVGSGPIVMGQPCGLDDAGVQACRALREAGCEVVVVNPNATTLMTDPATADRTYVEPLTAIHVARILEQERPDALLPTHAGDVGLALALALAEDGTLARFGVELLGITPAALSHACEPRPPVDGALIGWQRFEIDVARDVAGAVAVIAAVESVDPVGVHPGDAIVVTPPQTVSVETFRRLRAAAATAAVRASGLRAGVAHVELALNAEDGQIVVIEASPLVSRSASFASIVGGAAIAGLAAKLACGVTLDELPRHGARAGCVVKIPRWAFDKFPEVDPTLTMRPTSVGEAIGMGSTLEEALGRAVRALDLPEGGLTLGRPVQARELGGLLATPTPERLAAIADAYRAGWSTPDVHSLTRIHPRLLDAVREVAAGARGADTSVAPLTGVPGRPSVIVLGSGPNRLGQGIAHGHCAVHAAAALRAAGLDAVLINSNGGTASTDAGAFDRLYCQPLTLEDVLAVVALERPLGVIVQLGGRTALELAPALHRSGVRILGTSAEAIVRAGDRERLGALLADLGLARPAGAAAASLTDARAVAARLGYPVLVRPSGAVRHPSGAARRPSGAASRCAPRVVHGEDDLAGALSQGPAWIETFLEHAIEVDVDAVSDGRRVLIAGVMEHIETAGIHSGDAACALPPYSLGPDQVERLRRQTTDLALGLGVVGLVNVRFAVKNDTAYVLDVTPRAARTVPFVSKATGLSLVELAIDAMLGRPLPAIEPPAPGRVAVKEAVFPFSALDGVDVVLGPDMKSTGEVMAIDADFRQAYLKAQLAAGARLPTAGKVWISVRGADRRALVMLAKRLGELGFALVAAGETARVLWRHGMAVERLPDGDDERPRVLDLMRRGEIALAVDVPEDGRARARSAPARQEALRQNIPYYTTLDGTQAVIGAIEVLLKGDVQIRALQDDRTPLPLAA